MTMILLQVLVLELVALIIWGLMRPERTFAFPFLAAVAFAGYLLPQIMGLTHDPFLPDGALAKMIFISVLCLAATYLGYVSNRKPALMFQFWRFDHRRLLIGSALLSLSGGFFYYLVSQMSAEASLEFGGKWTGTITIYVFFSQLLTFGFAIALILHLQKPSWPSLVIILFDLALFVDRIVFQGRRAAMVELFLFALMALWFNRRWSPPRWAVIAGVILGTLVVNSIGDYRSTMLESDRTTWTGAGADEILDIDYLGNLKRNFSEGGFDVTNAAYRIDAVDRDLAFDYGLSLYNAAVGLYVPAQILGADLKRQLIIDVGIVDFSSIGYVPNVGSTLTGVSDAFASFWYLGAIKFFFIGLIISRWFRAAEQGNFVAQLIAILIAYQALVAFSFSTHYFFLRFIDLAFLLLPVLLFARITDTASATRR